MDRCPICGCTADYFLLYNEMAPATRDNIRGCDECASPDDDEDDF